MKMKQLSRMIGLVIWLATVQTSLGFYNPSTGRWLSRDPIEEEGGNNLYTSCQNNVLNHIDPFGKQASTGRLYTMGFDADAYGLVPFSYSVGFNTPWFVGGAVGGAIEIAYDCFDGSAEAFGVAWIGVGVGTPGFSIGGAKGLNFIYNLPTATSYSGSFVAVTGSGTFGAAGAYGTVFTTPRGALNLATTASVGSETWGFGAGWAYGTPSAGILFQYQYYWDLGSVPFTAQQRQSICRCKGAAPGAVPSQKIRAMAVAAGEDKKAVLKQNIKQSLPFVLSGNYANQKIDQAPWDENIW